MRSLRRRIDGLSHMELGWPFEPDRLAMNLIMGRRPIALEVDAFVRDQIESKEGR